MTSEKTSNEIDCVDSAKQELSIGNNKTVHMYINNGYIDSERQMNIDYSNDSEVSFYNTHPEQQSSTGVECSDYIDTNQHSECSGQQDSFNGRHQISCTSEYTRRDDEDSGESLTLPKLVISVAICNNTDTTYNKTVFEKSGYANSECESNWDTFNEAAFDKPNEKRQEKTGGEEINEFDDLDRGWAWVVLVANFCSFMLLGNGLYATGILHSVLLDRFKASVSLTSWAGALHTAMYALGGPLGTALIDRYSCRTAIVLSGMFFVVGYLATAFAPSIEVVIFTFGIIAGTGGGLGYTAGQVVINFYFKKRRNFALGVASAGVGAGIFALAPAVQFAREYYGDVGVFIFTAGIMVHQVLFGVLCFPSKLEMYLLVQRQTQCEMRNVKSNTSNNVVELFKLYLDVIRNKGILCLCLFMFFCCLGSSLLFLHLPIYIMSKGFTDSQATMFLSIIGLGSIAGRIIIGVAANHVHPGVIYIGAFAIVAIAGFAYPFIATHIAGQVTFAVIYGLLFGADDIVSSPMSLLFVDIQYLAAAIGWQYLFGGIGGTIGPVLAGLIVDNGGTYDQSLFVAASGMLLATVCGAVSNCFTRPKIHRSLEIVIEPTSEAHEITK